MAKQLELEHQGRQHHATLLALLLLSGGWKPLERERHKRELKEETQRTNLLIQTHLTAYRLMDTPQNRWHVLQLLSKPASRGRGR